MKRSLLIVLVLLSKLGAAESYLTGSEDSTDQVVIRELLNFNGDILFPGVTARLMKFADKQGLPNSWVVKEMEAEVVVAQANEKTSWRYWQRELPDGLHYYTLFSCGLVMELPERQWSDLRTNYLEEKIVETEEHLSVLINAWRRIAQGRTVLNRISSSLGQPYKLPQLTPVEDRAKKERKLQQEKQELKARKKALQQEWECSICFEPMEGAINTTGCGPHYFHLHCILQHQESKRPYQALCPLCNTPLAFSGSEEQTPLGQCNKQLSAIRKRTRALEVGQ